MTPTQKQRAAYHKEWYKRNRTKKIAEVRAWQALNKDKTLAYTRKWNAANREYFRQAYIDKRDIGKGENHDDNSN